jgi:C-terminal processing protease CtpA/Prc
MGPDGVSYVSMLREDGPAAVTQKISLGDALVELDRENVYKVKLEEVLRWGDVSS